VPGFRDILIEFIWVLAMIRYLATHAISLTSVSMKSASMHKQVLRQFPEWEGLSEQPPLE
jgi:hypothetical protein